MTRAAFFRNATGVSQRGALGAQQRHVIIFDEESVTERQTMVGPAAEGYRPFLKLSKARNGFSGIQQGSGIVADRVAKLSGQGGNAGEMLQKIQGDAFARQNRTGRSMKRCKDAACVKTVAIRDRWCHHDPGIDDLIHEIENRHACQDTTLLGHKLGVGAKMRVNERARGDIAEGDVFRERGVYQRFQVNGRQRSGGHGAS